ncbi:MAG: uroporphyrinogen-III C-methyltransferase [Candidatus Binatia bacterium]|jgi:uroporphyrinogen III methyltransferase/synthase|nr:uroporphyrinogen-III C-methyltransferase [Candidatus Binatia bacterium]
MAPGKVYLVGAGPGDPGLMTVRGMELLRGADVIIYDRLVNPLMLEEASSHAARIFVGKSSGNHSLPQEEINDLLIRHAYRGLNVVRLKGGDPFVFGRGSEETEALATAGIEFEITPGVSSAIGVPAYAGIPLTDRRSSSSFAVVTGHEDTGKRRRSVHWESLATAVDTLVILMGAKTLPGIAAKLITHGRSPETPVALIRWGTTEKQEIATGTLAEVRDGCLILETPVVVVVGEVVRFSSQLQWLRQMRLTAETRELVDGNQLQI